VEKQREQHAVRLLFIEKKTYTAQTFERHLKRIQEMFFVLRIFLKCPANKVYGKDLDAKVDIVMIFF